MESNSVDMLFYEKIEKANGFTAICGVDEAGRGPLAGPVVAAAVILGDDFDLSEINDSKKLTEKKREQLFPLIKEKALSYFIAIATIEEIDELNILNASLLAMKRAVEGLEKKADIALIDGNKTPKLLIPSKAIVKGDMYSRSIAAASILAKVHRDKLMEELDKDYPEYKFSKHKGYPTKLHYECILEHGISPVHRMTFLKKLIKEHPELVEG